jgi:hypothetical protein
MDSYIFDKNSNLWYELKGVYYPCLELSDEDIHHIGICGLHRKKLSTGKRTWYRPGPWFSFFLCTPDMEASILLVLRVT